MNTGVVGLGNTGSRLAENSAAGGQKIIVAAKTLANAEKLASDLRSNAEAMSVVDPIGKADVVIIAIYFDAINQLVATYSGPVSVGVIDQSIRIEVEGDLHRFGSLASWYPPNRPSH